MIVVAVWLVSAMVLRALIVTLITKIIIETAVYDDARAHGMAVRAYDVRMPKPLVVIEFLRQFFFPFWMARRFGDGVTVMSAGFLWPKIRQLVDSRELKRLPYQVLVVKISKRSPTHPNRYLFRYEDALRVQGPQ